MKLIHTADLHLDSRLTSHLTGQKRKERRNELLMNFERLCDFASSHQVAAILISGDLFDRDQVSETAAGMVRDVIRTYKDIEFYYLKGNHDTGGALSSDNVPDNLHLFSAVWQTYSLGSNIRIHGLELTGNDTRDALTSLKTDPDQINIVMLHGQLTENRNDTTDHAIYLQDLKIRDIDYLALGHIHERREDRLDHRGIYAYPGCLEGRGFDECGGHGFILLDIDPEKHRLGTTFVPFARRALFRVDVDVTGLSTTKDILTAVEKALGQEKIQEKDMVQVHLTGSTEAEAERDLSYITSVLEDRYYMAEIRDETTFMVHPETYQYDETLKGVFVRQVLEDESLSEDEKAAVIRYGILALKQEEL